jgi:hypothetical protein
LKYRIYMAFLLGIGFATLAFLTVRALGSNLLVAMLGVGVLMPGIGSVQAILHNCCGSPLPMLAANGLIYSAGAFVTLIWPITASVPRERLERLARSLTWGVAGTIAVGWGAALVIAWVWSAPSDETLARQFNRHRDELETLALMAKEDSVMSRIAYDFTWRQDSVAWPRPESDWGITEARWDQYRRLLRKVGATEGLSKDQQGNIYFLMHTEGSVVSGASKGFVYCQTTEASPGLILPCSEQRDFGKRDDGNGNGEEYRRLSDHWYIYSDRN